MTATLHSTGWAGHVKHMSSRGPRSKMENKSTFLRDGENSGTLNLERETPGV